MTAVDLSKEEKLNEEINTVSSIDALDNLVQRVRKAQEAFSTYTQEQVDEIFRKTALALNAKRIDLAEMAVHETGMGIIEDKVIKNHFAAEFIYNKYKNTKTCGILEEDLTHGIKKIAEPIGVIGGVVPTTNPTSTIIFKTLIALKTRNGIIFSPHPRAKKASVATVKALLEAAVKAGAPEDIVGCIDEPTVELSQHLMQHKGIDLILATGGPGMVKAAYSSGKPALGVGAGNTPAVIDESADIKTAVSSILMSKTFDNGVICASEQSVVVVDSIYEEVKKEFAYRGAYLLSQKEKEMVSKIIILEKEDGKKALNPEIVGQPAYKIAKLAGLNVPKEAKVLIGEAEKVGIEENFSFEKLSPVLALYKASDYNNAIQKAYDIVSFGGKGHTSVYYTNPNNQDRIRLFGNKMETGRILINTPASQGAIGDVYNFRLEPSLTLGCGSWGGNSASENIGVKHLMNIKTVSERRENMLWFKVPPKVYFKQGCTALALQELEGRKKALIVTDKMLYELGYADKVTSVLKEIGMDFQIFFDVTPDPTISVVEKSLERARSYQPDTIIALGGGSPIDAAKILWLMYEQPQIKFEDLALRFMDIEKRIIEFPKLGEKSYFVAIPTTSGTGSEVTPFAVITDDRTPDHVKYPIADYALTPNMAIVDPDFVLNMPKGLAAASGLDALTHAIEAYVSAVASSFTNGMALESIKLIFDNLYDSYNEGANNFTARENIHYASTIAGMSFSNAFLGICHSMAHKLGSAFKIPHGFANAMLISEIIKYNATDNPAKQATFSQYKYPCAKARYAQIADYLGLGCNLSEDQKIASLIEAIEGLKNQLGVPSSMKEYFEKNSTFFQKEGIDTSEQAFAVKVKEIARNAFDDQCTGANPVYPKITDLEEIYLKAYAGNKN